MKNHKRTCLRTPRYWIDVVQCKQWQMSVFHPSGTGQIESPGEICLGGETCGRAFFHFRRHCQVETGICNWVRARKQVRTKIAG